MVAVLGPLGAWVTLSFTGPEESRPSCSALDVPWFRNWSCLGYWHSLPSLQVQAPQESHTLSDQWRCVRRPLCNPCLFVVICFFAVLCTVKVPSNLPQLSRSKYVCMFLCMYVCTYVCMYVYACMYVCKYVFMYVCLFVFMYYLSMYVCMYVCMCVCVYIYIYVSMYVCM
jgi:hypothetical protein